MAARYCKGTVRGKGEDTFDPSDAAQLLRDAMKRFGTDEGPIIVVLNGHNNQQRQTIKETYKTAFGRDLVADLKDELGGNFRRLCSYLLLPEREFDAKCLGYALSCGPMTETLIDVLATRTNQEIHDIRVVYKELFDKELDDDIADHVSGDFKRVLVGLSQGKRSDDHSVDQEKVDQDVQDLYKAGVGQLGTDEDVFTAILVSRAAPHVQAVVERYQERHGQPLEKAIEDEMSGDTKRAFLAIVRCIREPVAHFAMCFHEAFKGPGTDDERLMQLIVSHSEVDLEDIAERYQKMYSRTLKEDVHSETSGDYRKLLIKILEQAEEE